MLSPNARRFAHKLITDPAFNLRISAAAKGKTEAEAIGVAAAIAGTMGIQVTTTEVGEARAALLEITTGMRPAPAAPGVRGVGTVESW